MDNRIDVDETYDEISRIENGSIPTPMGSPSPTFNRHRNYIATPPRNFAAAHFARLPAIYSGRCYCCIDRRCLFCLACISMILMVGGAVAVGLGKFEANRNDVTNGDLSSIWTISWICGFVAVPLGACCFYFLPKGTITCKNSNETDEI